MDPTVGQGSNLGTRVVGPGLFSALLFLLLAEFVLFEDRVEGRFEEPSPHLRGLGLWV